MRIALLGGAVVVTALLMRPSPCWPQTHENGAQGSAAARSGVYGFSGTGPPGSSDPSQISGAIGECVWIYDSENKRQVSKGDCDAGKFRVALPPGHYILRGPAGNKPIEVKAGSWTKADSVGQAYY